jgi:AcrR family transcriptional regulator
MARPRRFTDEEILAATQSCILEHGPSVSTTMIAEKLGISQAALFKRFGTKEQMIIGALRQPMQRNPVADLLALGPSDEPIRAQLNALGMAMIQVMRRVVPCMAMLHAAGLKLESDDRNSERPPIQARRLLVAWLQQAIDSGRLKPVDPHVVAVSFIGMLHARPFREIIVGDTDLQCSDEEYVTQLVSHLMDGIAIAEET